MHQVSIAAVCAVIACGGSPAPTTPVTPSSKPTEVAIWPGAIPDARAVPAPENRTTTVTDKLVAGRPWISVTNVARPTMTIYPPTRGPATGAAVVVFPGGGYKVLAIDLEGTEVCDWLTSKGITCVLLKYRVPFSGPYWDAGCKCHIDPKPLTALEDAQRTLGLLRARAAELHIDPHKIGVLGFSAGGHLVAAASTHEQRIYAPVDAADRESCRPDFAVALYPGHLWTDAGFELNPDIASHITARTPPTLLVQASDDDVDDVTHSLVYYVALQKAGVLVEMHLFARGGHAFGLRRTKLPITEWPRLVETWLAAIGVIGG